MKRTDIENFITLDRPMKKNILSNIKGHLDDMLERHNKVYAFRMDVHFPDDTTNKTFKTFQQRFIQACKREIGDTAYVAVREEGTTGNTHYHEFIMTDGNKTQSIYTPLKIADRIMKNTLKIESDTPCSNIDYCNHNCSNGTMLRRQIIENGDDTDLK